MISKSIWSNTNKFRFGEKSIFLISPRNAYKTYSVQLIRRANRSKRGRLNQRLKGEKMHHLRNRCNTSVLLFTYNRQNWLRASPMINNTCNHNHFATVTDSKWITSNHAQWRSNARQEMYNRRILKNDCPTQWNLYNIVNRRNIHYSSVVSKNIFYFVMNSNYFL